MKRTRSLILALLLIPGLIACARGTAPGTALSAPAMGPGGNGVLSFAACADAAPAPDPSDDPGELLARYFQDSGLNPDLVSVGCYRAGTGETWYWNPDSAYYSASLYKLPLMMLFAEKVGTGELRPDSEFFGMPLSDIETEVLVNSHNDLAYAMLSSLGDPAAVRRSFRRYASQPDAYYDWSFCALSYFNVRFMTDVLATLLREPERFPGILDRMKLAQPDHYFRLRPELDRFEIAQKYGSYHDEADNDWNHCCGVIFTPEPFALTVMTRYGGISENIIGDLAVIFTDLSLRQTQRDAP